MFPLFLIAFGFASVHLGVQCSERIVGVERIMSLPTSSGGRWESVSNYHDGCAGVLMSTTEVLTTCECVIHNSRHEHMISLHKREGDEIRLLDLSELRIRTKDIISLDSEFIGVSEVQVHPKCDGYGAYDFAMMRLVRPVNVSDKALANFPFGEEWNGKWSSTNEPDTGCHLATYLTNALMWDHSHKTMVKYQDMTEIPVDVIRMEVCNSYVKFGTKRRNFDKNVEICVEAASKVPICKADMGSPLICNNRLIGITTVTELTCNNQALSIVSSLDGSWNFIYDFMEIDFKHWFARRAKKLLIKSFKYLMHVSIGL